MATGGGSSSTTGQLVQTVAPQAAIAAGNIDAQAARDAANQYTSLAGSALSQVGQQYAADALNLQPATQVGVQALDQLTQYLGLNPYNPTAPTAPTLMSVNNAPITQDQIQNYIMAHSVTNGYAPGPGQVQNYVYQGVGSDNGPYAGLEPGGNPLDIPGTSFVPNGLAGNEFGSLTDKINNAITNELQQEETNQNAPINAVFKNVYDTNMAQYKTQLDNYKQAKALYDKYNAEGPLTSSQIQDRISNLPGYQAEQNQGIQAIQNSSSGKGLLGSGTMLQDLMKFGQNQLSAFYGQTLQNLASLAGAGNSAAQSQNANNNSEANSLSNLLTGIGTTQANSSLAQGNAMAQALLAANPQFKVYQTGSSSSDGGMNLNGIGSLIGALGGML